MSLKPAKARLHRKIVDREGDRQGRKKRDKEGRRREKDRQPRESWALKTPKALCCQSYSYTQCYTVVVETAKIPTLHLPCASSAELSALRTRLPVFST